MMNKILDKFRTVKLNVTLSAVLTVILGVVLVIWPGETVQTFARVFGAIILCAGVLLLLSALRGSRLALIGALLLIAVGIWAFATPKAFSSILPVAAGVLLITHGVQDLVMMPALRRYQAAQYGLTVLFALISIVFGIVCIANAFGIVKLIMVVIGLMLIYDGVTDMLIVRKYNYFRRRYEPESGAPEEEHIMIDAQGKPFLEEIGRAHV